MYVGGSGFAAALRMLGGFLAVRLMLPAELGLFNGIALLIGYLRFADMGTSHGLNREVPYFEGQNEPGRARSLAATALSWALIIGTLSAAALLAVAVWHACHARWLEAAGFGSVAVQAFLLFLSMRYLEIVYRTKHAFDRLVRIYVIRALAALALVAAVWLLGYYGMCLRAAGTLLVGAALLWWWNPMRIKPKWCFADLKHLMKVGFPVMVVIEVSMLWSCLNRTLIFMMMGRRELGLYALYPMMLPALGLLPMAMNHVVYPRVSLLYGRTGSLREITRYAIRPVLLLSAAMIPVVGLIWLALPLLVELLLPKYVDGVAAARWAMIDVVVFCLMQIRMVYFTIRQQHWMLLAIFVGIAIYVGALLWLVRHGAYLEAFPQAMVIGRVSYVAVCYLILGILCKRDRHEPE